MDPEEREKYQSRDFRIHRKYILVLSVVQFIFIFGGVKFKSINFVGFIAEIENPEVIQISILILMIYSLVRYYQYFDTDCLGYLISNYRNILNGKFSHYATKKIIAEMRSEGTLHETDELYDPTTVNLNQFSDSEKGYIVAHELNFNVTEVLSNDMKRIVVEGKVKKSVLKYLQLKSIFIYVIKRPYFFELIFPIILGLVSLGFGLQVILK